MARNYAALYHEYREEMEALSDAEFGRLCRALIDYSASGTPIELSGNERFYAKRVMCQEDRTQAGYKKSSDDHSKAGAIGAAKRWQNIANDSKPKQPIATDGKNSISKSKSISISTNVDNMSNTDVLLVALRDEIITAWNALGLSQVSRIAHNSTRFKMLNARLREYGKEDMLRAIRNIRSSSFLRGQNKNGWVITFDWLIRPNNFVKVRDGNYNDTASGNQPARGRESTLDRLRRMEQEGRFDE